MRMYILQVTLHTNHYFGGLWEHLTLIDNHMFPPKIGIGHLTTSGVEPPLSLWVVDAHRLFVGT